jgi:hypothetical protein
VLDLTEEARCAEHRQHGEEYQLRGLDQSGSSISCIAGWSQAEPALLTAIASNVLRGVNIIAARLSLDDAQDVPADETSADVDWSVD